MIGFLRGTVHAFGLDYCLLDVNGVGYRIRFHHPEALSAGKEMTIYTYQNVREDEISLFGFLSLEEYDLFVKLISVKGLGPKIATNILATASVGAVIEAVENGNVAFMKRMPGVGNKMASQIILDLKGKLVEAETAAAPYNEKLRTASEALKSLGYKPSEIKSVIKKLSEEDMSEDEYIRKALGMLAK
jgi:Holliday junction DNA helicase RuvA